MKRVFFAALLAVIVLPLFGAKTIHEKSIERAVAGAEHRWEEALKQFDTGAMQSLLAQDDSQTDYRGVVQDKASWMQSFKRVAANVRSGKTRWDILFDEENVRIYGDVAIVTGRGTFKGTRKGALVKHVIRFTNVWVNRQDAWQLVNYQATPILAQ